MAISYLLVFKYRYSLRGANLVFTLRFGTQDQPYWLLCDKVLVVPRDMPQLLFPLSNDMKGSSKSIEYFFKKQCPVSEQASLCTGCMELLKTTLVSWEIILLQFHDIIFRELNSHIIVLGLQYDSWWQFFRLQDRSLSAFIIGNCNYTKI